MKKNAPAKPRGRPRAFDREAALDAAMLLFWKHGYEATSLSQLTAAMGISPPSLYAAFGDKETLFLETVARYEHTRGGDQTKMVLDSAKTAREAVHRLLTATAFGLSDPKYPRGCMVVLSALTVSEEATRVQCELARSRADRELALQARVERGIAEGDVPASVDAAALAAFYMTVLHGMSLQARDGASRERLQDIVRAALAAWPADDARA